MTNRRMHTAEGGFDGRSSRSEPSDSSGDDPITDVGIYEWPSDTMILAHVKPQEENPSSGISEKFLLLYACPESIEQLYQYPFEILNMWISSAGFPMEHVREINSWPGSENKGARRLVLRCDSGRMYGVDEEGARYLKPSNAVWAQS